MARKVPNGIDNNMGVSIIIPGNPYFERMVTNRRILRENIFFFLRLIIRLRKKEYFKSTG
jgi:hypothetical protein